MNWRQYHRLPVIHGYMRKLEAEFPELVQTLVIGESVEGREMLVAKVGKKQHYEKPAIFIEGGEYSFLDFF